MEYFRSIGVILIRFVLLQFLLCTLCQESCTDARKYVKYELLQNSTHGCHNGHNYTCHSSNYTPHATVIDINISKRDFVNFNEKILMSWTPKAASAEAVLMFLDTLGFRENVDFVGFVHDFRVGPYYHLCGLSNICLYADESFYKFKVVRNPFSRFVSSFLHLVDSHPWDSFRFDRYFADVKGKDDLSFTDFVHLVATLHELGENSQIVKDVHIREQVYHFEYSYWEQHGKSLYDRIVKLENYADDIAAVSMATGLNFRSEFFFMNASAHVTTKSDVLTYVGDLPWRELKKNIPRDYGLFYRTADIELVSAICKRDLQVYNYTYPYN